ncbi:response regulator transcription factor [Paraburkholderia susongensis]|uniref:DNA-binding response regulator, OmpR family, contains REC and winged-helix (WHTH) domain n=1 Tax=Paraburkholderia susongensis TaxID=1515439 RepID=A0A1X7M4M3_9BURK|nr:response regulator transcription factor [Paraburkholderia susongensis]SMG61146.1 DNA-binding response regulator, OmpR family, contains REC and winged-helix (wHTH) domain [Paraburkholderia susongensis]
MRIAVLEDDLAHQFFIYQTLRDGGHECHTYSTGSEFQRELKKQTFDLLVLDWNVPDLSGEDVLRWARETLSGRIPILFVTSRASDSDVSFILGMGADDYVTKPVGASVLLARVDSLLRRAYRLDRSDSRETYGAYEFDVSSMQVFVNGPAVVLTQKEFELALLLFRNMGRPLSRAYILGRVWKHVTDVSSRTMDTHVSMLRLKLNLRPEWGYRLAPVYGYGYRLDSVRGECV